MRNFVLGILNILIKETYILYFQTYRKIHIRFLFSDTPSPRTYILFQLIIL